MKSKLIIAACSGVFLVLSSYGWAADRAPIKISPDTVARTLTEHMRGAIDPTLMMLKEDAVTTARKNTPEVTFSEIAGLSMHGPRVNAGVVRIEALSLGNDGTLIAQLAAAGALNVRVSGNLLFADVPLSSIEKLPAITQAKFIRPSARYVTNTGKATSQGDSG